MFIGWLIPERRYRQVLSVGFAPATRQMPIAPVVMCNSRKIKNSLTKKIIENQI
jgi:hypothetical protein